jgi:transposase
LAVTVSPGQCHESTRFEVTMDEVRIPQPVGRPKQRPEALAGDKAYSSQAIRDWLKKHGIKDVIPTKSNEKPRPGFDKEAYRRRNVVERCIGWLKECRRILTRFEKLAVNFVAMFKLAMIRRYFRVLADTA